MHESLHVYSSRGQIPRGFCDGLDVGEAVRIDGALVAAIDGDPVVFTEGGIVGFADGFEDSDGAEDGTLVRSEGAAEG